MKHLIAALFISAAIAVSAADEATIASTNNTVVTANATLKDGSTIKGEFLAQKITGSTIFLRKLALDPSIVKSISFPGTNNAAKIELENGDKFTMKVHNKTFPFASILGELIVPRKNFRSITLSTKRISAGGCEDGLVFYCTFDDETSVAAPVVGPAVKMELGKIVADKGKSGGALFVNPGIAGAQIVFPSGSFTSEGCIEFWANMASGKTEFSTGGDPRFFILLDSNGAEKGGFEFASNDGAGNSGICGTFFGIHAYSNSGYSYMMPYSDIFKGEDYNGWHHYAFVWAQNYLKIFIDGKEKCRATGNLNAQEIANTTITIDIPLNRITGKSFNNKSAFYMDELKIWNKAKTEFDL